MDLSHISGVSIGWDLRSYFQLNGKTKFDDHENIRVRLIKLAEVEQLVIDGKIRHALVIAALYYFKLHREG